MLFQQMGAHIFIVDRETYATHRDYGFCAIGKKEEPAGDSEDLKGFHGIVADLVNTRHEDLVFFYVRSEGFRGIYRVTSWPFQDDRQVGSIGAERPFRILIDPIYSFETAVPENALFRTPELQRTFWIWFFAKMRMKKRGCNPLDPDAADKLIELLIKYNGGQLIKVPTPRRYPAIDGRGIALKLSHPAKESAVASEDALRAGILKCLADKDSNVTALFGDLGDLEWYANNVPFHVAGNNIDILAYHRSKPVVYGDRSVQARYRYTVIELKKDVAGTDGLHQLLNYCRWVGDQLAQGEDYLVQPILVARNFSTNLLEFVKHLRLNYRPVQLYKFAIPRNRLNFNRVYPGTAETDTADMDLDPIPASKAIRRATGAADVLSSRVLERALGLSKRGLTLGAIAKTLNGEGFPTARGGQWRRNSVERLLAREESTQDFD